ncbi:MAG: AAA family ATPase, partial [Erysipelotrichaceae bacterium]|nr:AAA family ATPase [Erysipelotrichaceae bacterium]
VIHRGGSMTGGKTKGQSSLMSAQKDLKQINIQMDSEAAKAQLSQQKIAKLQGLRKSIESDLMEKRINSAQLEPIIDAKRAKYEKYKNDLAALGADDGNQVEVTDNDLVVRLNNAYHRRDELTNSIRSKREERTRLINETERKEQQIRQIRKDLNLALASRNAIEVDKARIETKLDNQLQRLGSEYQMTYEFALTQVGDVDVESAKEEVAQLRYDIEHLGNINMNAPEEFDEVNTRYEFMSKQMKDLEESRDKILKAIDEMDSVMTKQFKEMFYKINNELSDVFRQLFGGGKASLILEDPTDLLNTGIDIDVQPPGKAVQNIRLFSGGEKSLIALCVLFAILKVKPVPLVIFDEVEAALDQGNVERFARFIKNYEDQTQFIVVTHRPGTMQECDILYGVTMQKAGVSQMLKVELMEAMEMAEKEEES